MVYTYYFLKIHCEKQGTGEHYTVATLIAQFIHFIAGLGASLSVGEGRPRLKSHASSLT